MTSFEDTVNIQYRNQDLICISPEVILSLYLYPLRIVDEAGEDDNAEDEEEDQQHQLLGGGSECLQEDLEPAGVPGEFEKPEDPDDAEELEHVRVLDVGDEVLEDEVGVEADGGHEVNNIDGGLEEITFVWTTEEPEMYISKTLALYYFY